jgi:hypothetical protein
MRNKSVPIFLQKSEVLLEKWTELKKDTKYCKNIKHGGLTPPRIPLTPLIKCSSPPKFRFTPPILCERL